MRSKPHRRGRAIFQTAAIALALCVPAAPATLAAQVAHTTHRLHCGAGPVAAGFTRIDPTQVYSPQRGYGFLAPPGSAAHAASAAARAPLCSGDDPFFFAAAVPEGNYDVTVTFGHPTEATELTVKAESRRLMLERVRTEPGEFATRSFTVNVRTHRIHGGGEVRLNDREVGGFTWDDRLTLEFNGTRPSVRSLEIRPADGPITLYLAGNSTVTDQTQEPWAAWGQMLPRFFQPHGVAVANHAESGQALRSFVASRRLDKILSTIRPGDYLFVEFGHNDQKPGGAYAEPFTTYREHLRLFATEARKRGAIPVFVTPVQRRSFDEHGRVVNTLGDYPEAMRQAAREEGVALIDLHAMTRVFYEALGPEGSTRAFVHYPAGTFPGQREELRDDSHFNNYGAYQLARMVVQALRAADPRLAAHLAADAGEYDPAHPQPVESFHLPHSPPPPALTVPEGS